MTSFQDIQPAIRTLRAISAPWLRGVELFLLADRRTDGKSFIVTEMVYSEREFGTEPVGAAPYALQIEQAQTLMDDLWACGLRPTEGAGSAGALAATQAHLKDMQRLVFDKVRTE